MTTYSIIKIDSQTAKTMKTISGKYGTCAIAVNGVPVITGLITELKKDLIRVQAREIKAVVKKVAVEPRGNWNTARDWFPTIDVDQDRYVVEIGIQETSGYQDNATVETMRHEEVLSLDGQSLFVRGEVGVKNWRIHRCSGSQKFCFAIFFGDSGHIYVHRAPATSGWMHASPDTITARLRKLGVGAEKGVIQQGDFLLKPANGNAYPDGDFAHETMGAGHHKFVCPVLSAWSREGGTQYKIVEPTMLVHEAVDGIQHPDVLVPVGVYVVGTTAPSLRHGNRRD